MAESIKAMGQFHGKFPTLAIAVSFMLVLLLPSCGATRPGPAGTATSCVCNQQQQQQPSMQAVNDISFETYSSVPVAALSLCLLGDAMVVHQGSLQPIFHLGGHNDCS